MYDIQMIIWYYGVSATEAYKILKDLSEEELQQIWKDYNNYINGKDM